MIKNGQQHIESLRDGRSIFLDGEKISDPTAHPAYRGAIASVGRMYDFQCRPDNRELMTYDTGDGTPASRIWQLPGSYEELKARRTRARSLGRTPRRLPRTRARPRRLLHLRDVHGAGGLQGL